MSGKAPRQKGIVWKPAQGFPDYEVSESGAARRVTRALTRASGHVVRGSLQGGYWKYKLATPNGKRIVAAHRLVALAFIGPPPTDKHVVAHWDGDRLHNHFSNLRWATTKENHSDRPRHGTDAKGERNGRSVLTEQQVAALRLDYQNLPGDIRKVGVKQLFRQYGIGPTAAYYAIKGRHWSHVGG